MGLEIVHRSTSDTYSKLPLRRFRIVDTARAEEAEHVLSRELSHLRIRGTADRSRFRLRMNGAHLGGVMVGFNHFDVHTTIEPGELDDAFILSFGDEVPSLMVADSRSVVMSSTTAAMLSPSCRLLIDRPEGSGVFLVRTTPEALEEHLRTLTESDLREPLRFVRRVDFSSEPGATVLRLVRFVISNSRRAALSRVIRHAGPHSKNSCSVRC